MDQLHESLAPVWQNLVDDRNNAGLVGPKDEGKPQPPMSKEEVAFQYERVQKGEVDSARLLLVFGMVPSASYLDNATMDLFEEEKGGSKSSTATADAEDSSNVPAVLDPHLRYPDGNTPLHMAATFGLKGSLEALLAAGADVNSVSGQGLQAIHCASIMGHMSAVDLLAQHGADVNAVHGFAGSTPMHFATEMGHPAVVKRLCELGADVDAEKRHGGTPIHVSADTNNAAVTKVLVEEPCGADPEAVLLGDTVPLYLAAGRGFASVIDVLLEAGADPDRTLWPNRPWHKKKPRKQRKQKASTELQEFKGNPAHNLEGSDPNGPGWEAGNGATALHNAVENGHLDAAVALLDGGALQLATMQGVTPLITAMQYKQRKIGARLLDHRTPANVLVANPGDGQTALHVAAAYDYPEIVARILREGGKTDIRDRRGNRAMDYSRGPLTRMLLARFHGRDPKLDNIVRAHRDSAEAALEHLEQATGADEATHKLYVKFAKLHVEERLAEEVQRLGRLLTSGDVPKGKEDVFLQKFAVARFVGQGSDGNIAVEVMLKRTLEGMHSGLALINVHVRDIEYTPKEKLVVNGVDLLRPVNEAIAAVTQDSDLDAFLRHFDTIRAAAHGLAAPTSSQTAAVEVDSCSADGSCDEPPSASGSDDDDDVLEM